jgi:hypothetical protein
MSALGAPGTASTAATATCAAGKVLLGGGAQVTQGSSGSAAILSSYPASTTQWSAQAVITSTGLLGAGNVSVTAYALCSQ